MRWKIFRHVAMKHSIVMMSDEVGTSRFLNSRDKCKEAEKAGFHLGRHQLNTPISLPLTLGFASCRYENRRAVHKNQNKVVGTLDKWDLKLQSGIAGQEKQHTKGVAWNAIQVHPGMSTESRGSS